MQEIEEIEKADDEWAERLKLKIEESSQKEMRKRLDDFDRHFNRFFMIYGLFTLVIMDLFFVLNFIVG